MRGGVCGAMGACGRPSQRVAGAIRRRCFNAPFGSAPVSQNPNCGWKPQPLARLTPSPQARRFPQTLL